MNNGHLEMLQLIMDYVKVIVLNVILIKVV